MDCESTCKGYKKLGLTACEGCSGIDKRKSVEHLQYKESMEWLINVSEDELLHYQTD